MEMKTGNEKTHGIFVRKVHPDSCVDTLENGDIIKRMDYQDSFWASKDAFSINNHDPDVICNGSTITVLCYFDCYGDSSVCTRKKGDEKLHKLIDRKMSFAEIMDMVPIGADLNLQICRDKEWYMVQAKHTFKKSKRVLRFYPRLDPIDYEIFAGLCCSNLDMSHVDTFDNLTLYTKDSSNRYTKRVVICQVFPDTTASRTQVLRQGHIIDTLNETKIGTLDDIRKILRTRPDKIQITTKDKSFFMVSTDKVILEDKRAMKNFNIRNHNYLLESEQA